MDFYGVGDSYGISTGFLWISMKLHDMLMDFPRISMVVDFYGAWRMVSLW